MKRDVTLYLFGLADSANTAADITSQPVGALGALTNAYSSSVQLALQSSVEVGSIESVAYFTKSTRVLAGISGAGAALGAAQVAINISNGKEISPGDVISIGTGIVAVAIAVGAIGITSPLVIPVAVLGGMGAAANLFGLSFNTIFKVLAELHKGSSLTDIEIKDLENFAKNHADSMAFLRNGPGKKGVSNNVSREWNAAQRRAPPQCDPLVFDLNGNGIETVDASVTTPILFDHDGDGIKTGTGWVPSTDGFLVRDRNGNGAIDSGAELFGDATPLDVGGKAANGFAALAQEDTNKDGRVDGADSNWNQLRIWRDINQDGISQGSELFTLDSLNIASISTAQTEYRFWYGNGNQVDGLGVFKRGNGTTGSMGDINLAQNTFYRDFSDHIALVAGAEALPDMAGSGRVRDLREAASQSNALFSLLSTFSSASTREVQQALLDELLMTWASTSCSAKTLQERTDGRYAVVYQSIGARGPTVVNAQGQSVPDPAWTSFIAEWEKKIKVLSEFNGRDFFLIPGQATPGAVSAAGISLGGKNTAGLQILNVTLSTDQLRSLNASYDALRQSVYSTLAMQTRLKPLVDLIAIGFTDGDVHYDFTAVNSYFSSKLAENAPAGLAELIDFDRCSSQLLADAGWKYSRSVEQLIADTVPSPSLLQLYHELGFLIVDPNVRKLRGTSEADTIYGSSYADVINGLDGNNIVFGGNGNDTINGGLDDDLIDGGDGADTINDYSGNNTLKGGAGNDVINGSGSFEGGAGDDILNGTGYFSNDFYRFNLGDGRDTINDWSNIAYDPTDTLIFGSGISASAIKMERLGNDLIFKINAADQVTVAGWFGIPMNCWYADDDMHYEGDGCENFKRYSRIEEIRFADGSKWGNNVLRTMEITATGTAGADTIDGWAGRDVLDGGAGDDILKGDGGSDQLSGGAGNDNIDGGWGDDVIDGGDGDDVITDADGNNTLKGGAGNDSIIGRGTFEGGAGDDVLISKSYYSADTYIFNAGDGKDTITDYSSHAYVDTLSFGAGITADQLWLRKVGNDLDVGRIGTFEGVVIKDWYLSEMNHLEQFRTAEGKVLLNANVDALVSAMAAFAPPMAGQSSLSTAYQTALNPIIAANWR